ncbi:MAG: RNA degradosome polyphosphate kinase, partial [Geminicoccaceae bacterium]
MSTEALAADATMSPRAAEIIAPEADEVQTEVLALMQSPERFFNRELSWLAFNERVFEEADNKSYPLLERLRFLSISADILDEFTMVRVAGLLGQMHAGVRTLSPDGLSPAEQLELINGCMASLLERQQVRWKEIRALLLAEKITVLEPGELTAKERHWLDRHFMARLFP